MLDSQQGSSAEGLLPEAEWSFEELWRLVRRYFWWFFLALVFGALGGWFGSQLQEPVWEARTQVLVTRAPKSGAELDPFQSSSIRDLLNTYKTLLSEPWVREELARRLGVASISSKQIRISTSQQNLLLQIAARDTDPNRARQMADTLVQILIEQHQHLQEERYRSEEERLTRQIEEVQKQIDRLQEELASLPPDDEARREQIIKALDVYRELYLNLLDKRETVRLYRLYNVPNLVQVQPAQLVPDPVAPKTLLNTLAGGLVGLMLAAGVVFLREALDQTIHSEEELRRMNLPVLATIVETEKFREEGGPLVWRKPQSPYAEMFRILRTNLEFFIGARDIHVFLVTSPAPEERKTSLAANLAAIFAQAGKRVLLIDADFRRPRIHRIFGLLNRNGFSTLFRYPDTPISQVLYRWKNSSLYVLPTGKIPPYPAEMLRSPLLQRFLEEFRQQFELVIIDAPPIIVADAMILAAHVDGILLSVVQGQTHREALRKTLQTLRHEADALAPVLGAVLFLPASEYDRHNRYYYTRYYYGYTQTIGEAYEPEEVQTA